MVNEKKDEIQIDIYRVIHAVLRRSILILVVACIAGGGIYYYVHKHVRPSFNCSGKIYVIDREEKSIKVSIEELNVGSQLVEDYKTLITSRIVLEQVISRLNLDLTYKQLEKCVMIDNPVDTRIITISVNYDDKNNIRRVLNTIEDVTCNELANKLGTGI